MTLIQGDKVIVAWGSADDGTLHWSPVLIFVKYAGPAGDRPGRAVLRDLALHYNHFVSTASLSGALTMTTLKTLRNDGYLIRQMIDFHAAMMHGITTKGSPTQVLGYLPQVWVDTFKLDHATYVIYSYNTPIAWYGNRGWVVPPVKYSQTTGRHQGIVRAALSSYKTQ